MPRKCRGRVQGGSREAPGSAQEVPREDLRRVQEGSREGHITSGYLLITSFLDRFTSACALKLHVE